MSDDYSQFINYFKQHLGQLKMCDDKVDEIFAETKKIIDNYKKIVEDAGKDSSTLMIDINAFLPKISKKTIEEQKTKIDKIKNDNSFFTNQNEESEKLRSNASKLNLLTEAALKSKFFIVNRIPKVMEKFNTSENVAELTSISKTATKIAEGIVEEVGKLNAEIALLLAKELEANSRFQTVESIVGELNKRFSLLD